MRHVGLASAAAAVGLSCAIAACNASNAPVTPSHDHGSMGHAVSGAAVGGDPAVGPQLAEVRAATAIYHDVANAHAAGYPTANEPCVASPAGTMGIHAANQALIADPALDPLRPELLLYEPKNGDLKLVAVEYLKFVVLRNRTSGATRTWVSPTRWDPAVYEIAIPTPQLFGKTFDGPMAGHTPTMPWHWDLHVWIWAPNPNGMFTQFNPKVHCN